MTPLHSDPSADDELPRLAATWVQEIRMPDTPTRTTVNTSDIAALGRLLGLPPETDPTKVVRAATVRISDGQQAEARQVIRAWLVQRQAELMDERA